MSKQIAVNIQNPEVWAQFKAFVMKKWGKLHTALAIEVEAALVEYMQRHMPEIQDQNSTHNPIQIIDNNKPPSSMNTPGYSYLYRYRVNSTVVKFVEIVRMIPKDLYRISEDDVEKIVIFVVGGNHKTIQLYKKMLQQYEVITPERRHYDNGPIMYLINHKAVQSVLDGTFLWNIKGLYSTFKEGTQHVTDSITATDNDNYNNK